ncbi:MAG TPA: type I restriction endonuclease subunit R [Abditibacterium sp.]|jgi:type I restriction enzyme R subunit
MTPDFIPSHREDDVSQLPALHLLQNLGFVYLSPSEALAMRGGRTSNLLLEPILKSQLERLNRIETRGKSHEWTQSNLQNAIRALKEVPFGGLLTSNNEITNLLLLGKAIPQTIDDDRKSHTLQYIDWNPQTWAQNNVFHVTEEFSVERSQSSETRRPDLILFVNGIPLGVIECKSPQVGVEEGVSQHIRNQRDDEIPALYTFAQVLLSVAQNAARYGTTQTRPKFWSVWKEEEPSALQALVRKPLSLAAKNKMFALGEPHLHRTAAAREQFEALETTRLVTEQDRAIFALCRPERLLELIHDYALFDAGEKKIARWQQYLVVKSLIERIQKRDATDQRRGGLVWHTQGSGKSLTMVMLAKVLARLGLPNAQIVLVNDRIELDGQILRTFDSCDVEVVKAPTGPQLPALLQNGKSQVITTTLQKFKSAAQGGFSLDNPNVFVLVDESHRSQFGEFHSRMKQALPSACYLGFTGTPIKTKDKDTLEQFGGLVQPVYTIRQAVDDGAVLRLLYEGREVPQEVDEKELDRWFEIKTRDLSPDQRTDLKRKYSRADQISKVEKRVIEIALDISEHYKSNWRGTGLKAQLVAPDKATALRYREHLRDFEVRCEVVISAPDSREGNDDTDESQLPPVQAFWKQMMARFGTEKNYNDEIVAKFKGDDEDSPEILIVVDKLLTGFDAPRNTVLYLTRQLQGHTLLQAIARVNRLFEAKEQGKEFGYILDYRGVLDNLGEAMSFYDQLAEYDASDVEGAFTEMSEEIALLPQHHSDLWDVFSGVNHLDGEAMQLHLGDEARRDTFYERLSRFARSFKLALSSPKWLEKTSEPAIDRFRRDLKFFLELRAAVAQRYAEKVDFKAYEAQIQKLLDRHVGASAAVVVTEEFDIFDREAFAAQVSQIEGSDASKADQIAHRLKKSIDLNIEEDPAFYQPFSQMVEETIRAFREQRLAANEYLAKMRAVGEAVSDRSRAQFPPALADEPIAQAFYGLLRPVLETHLEPGALDDSAARWALRTDATIRRRLIVHWARNIDLQNQLKIELGDEWFDLAAAEGFSLAGEEIDALAERIMEVAKRRYAG